MEAYLAALEAAMPKIRAIGVTDYYLIDTYWRVRTAKQLGRLPDCNLIFPNIEMRLDIATQEGRQVNIHLLVNPTDADHVGQLTGFLGRLTFRAWRGIQLHQCRPHKAGKE